MRESSLRLVNYGMILAILVALGIHIAQHAFLGVASYEDSLAYDRVVDRYRSVGSAAVLGVLLVAATYHGLFGLRNLLLDVRSGRRWERGVSLGILAVGVAVVGWGLRTMALAALGG